MQALFLMHPAPVTSTSSGVQFRQHQLPSDANNPHIRDSLPFSFIQGFWPSGNGGEDCASQTFFFVFRYFFVKDGRRGKYTCETYFHWGPCFSVYSDSPFSFLSIHGCTSSMIICSRSWWSGTLAWASQRCWCATQRIRSPSLLWAPLEWVCTTQQDYIVTSLICRLQNQVTHYRRQKSEIADLGRLSTLSCCWWATITKTHPGYCRTRTF